MGTPLVLTFDIGTQSARCLLVRQDGSFRASPVGRNSGRIFIMTAFAKPARRFVREMKKSFRTLSASQ